MSAPGRRQPVFTGLPSPAVCGALGSPDPERVRAMAGHFPGRTLRVVHQDQSSMLAMDRDPLKWGRSGTFGLGRTEGLAWIEGLPWRPGATTWEEASERGARGLVVEGRQRRVHSSANGVGPVYWMADDDAVYFSTRIDPLVQTSPRLLTIDWDAWSSIITMRFPASDRTPFAEVRRLPPHSTLTWHRGAALAEQAPWPWARAEPRLGAREVGEALAVSMRATVAGVGRPVIVPLSGGRDSRMLAVAFAEAGLAERAITVSDDEGDRFEEGPARLVAESLGLEHDKRRARPEDYPRNWLMRARSVEHQFVDHAWLVPLARYVARRDLPVSDGYAIDTLLGWGNRFFTPETIDVSNPRRASLALFDSMRRYGRADLALAEPLRETVVERSRSLFLEVAEPIEGSPLQAPLIFYRSRTVRGVGSYPTGLLGQRASMVIPAADHDFAMAALSATFDARAGDGLYRAAFDALDPTIGNLPSTSDMPRGGVRRERNWRSDPAVAAHSSRLAKGPLSGLVAPELTAWLESSPREELSPDLRLGLEGISLLHDWCERYRDRLRDVDVSDLTG